MTTATKETTFDASQHLRCLKCGLMDNLCKCGHLKRAYLETAWRLVWFRDKFAPDAVSLNTDIISDGTGAIIVRATVKFPNDVVVDALGSCQIAPGRIYSGREVEKAETAALGRLMARLGYGTQFTGELDDDIDGMTVDAPVAKAPAPKPVAKRVIELDPNLQTAIAESDNAPILCAICGGETKYTEGNRKSDGKPYAGYFCLADKDHKPKWVPTGEYRRPEPKAEAPAPVAHIVPTELIEEINALMGAIPEEEAAEICGDFAVAYGYNKAMLPVLAEYANLTEESAANMKVALTQQKEIQ
jgi:hypothetical protein